MMTDDERLRATQTWAAVGRRVRRGKQCAYVVAVDNEYAKGAVYLDEPIENFRWWNVEELMPTLDPLKNRGRPKCGEIK